VGEVFGNVAIVFPHTGEPTSSNRYGRLEFARHFSDSGNILFMDGHVSLHNTSLDDADSANRLDDYTTNPYQRTDPGIVWGVFGR